jgi:dihydroorotate dehydrogenase
MRKWGDSNTIRRSPLAAFVLSIVGLGGIMAIAKPVFTPEESATLLLICTGLIYRGYRREKRKDRCKSK